MVRGMISRIVPLLALLMASCATAPAPRAAETPATAAVPGNSGAAERIAQLLRTAGRDDAATLQAVERALGAPDLRRQEGAGAALTYRLANNCALLLVFAADARNALRLTEATPGPRENGVARPSLEQCAAAAAARS